MIGTNNLRNKTFSRMGELNPMANEYCLTMNIEHVIFKDSSERKLIYNKTFREAYFKALRFIDPQIRLTTRL